MNKSNKFFYSLILLISCGIIGTNFAVWQGGAQQPVQEPGMMYTMDTPQSAQRRKELSMREMEQNRVTQYQNHQEYNNRHIASEAKRKQAERSGSQAMREEYKNTRYAQEQQRKERGGHRREEIQIIRQAKKEQRMRMAEEKKCALVGGRQEQASMKEQTRQEYREQQKQMQEDKKRQKEIDATRRKQDKEVKMKEKESAKQAVTEAKIKRKQEIDLQKQNQKIAREQQAAEHQQSMNELQRQRQEMMNTSVGQLPTVKELAHNRHMHHLQKIEKVRAAHERDESFKMTRNAKWEKMRERCMKDMPIATMHERREGRRSLNTDMDKVMPHEMYVHVNSRDDKEQESALMGDMQSERMTAQHSKKRAKKNARMEIQKQHQMQKDITLIQKILPDQAPEEMADICTDIMKKKNSRKRRFKGRKFKSLSDMVQEVGQEQLMQVAHHKPESDYFSTMHDETIKSQWRKLDARLKVIENSVIQLVEQKYVEPLYMESTNELCVAVKELNDRLNTLQQRSRDRARNREREMVYKDTKGSQNRLAKLLDMRTREVEAQRSFLSVLRDNIECADRVNPMYASYVQGKEFQKMLSKVATSPEKKRVLQDFNALMAHELDMIAELPTASMTTMRKAYQTRDRLVNDADPLVRQLYDEAMHMAFSSANAYEQDQRKYFSTIHQSLSDAQKEAYTLISGVA